MPTVIKSNLNTKVLNYIMMLLSQYLITFLAKDYKKYLPRNENIKKEFWAKASALHINHKVVRCYARRENFIWTWNLNISLENNK